MRKILASLMLVSLPASAALETGMRYDFYQKSGQHVLNAELLEESERDYTVKLRYVPKPIKISKTNLAKKPQLSANQPLRQQSAGEKSLLRPAVYTGYSALIIGPLSNIFASGLQAGLGLDWHLFRRPFWGMQALSAQTHFSYYQNNPRFIRQFSLYVGAQFRLYHWQRANTVFTFTPLAGISFVSLTGYTFNSEYFVPSGLAVFEVRKNFHRINFGIMLYTNYLFDQALFFSATGVGASAQYLIDL